MDKEWRKHLTPRGKKVVTFIEYALIMFGALVIMGLAGWHGGEPF